MMTSAMQCLTKPVLQYFYENRFSVYIKSKQAKFQKKNLQNS